VREHLLSSCGNLRYRPCRQRTPLCSGRSIPHEFVEEGLDGSARPEFPWYQEPPSIAYCMHDRQIGTDCILRENLFASNFSSDGTTPAESFLYAIISVIKSICRVFEVKSIWIGEQIDFDDQRHALRIERPEAGQAVLPAWRDLPAPRPLFRENDFRFRSHLTQRRVEKFIGFCF